jgi:hypothetical protein
MSQLPLRDLSDSSSSGADKMRGTLMVWVVVLSSTEQCTCVGGIGLPGRGGNNGNTDQPSRRKLLEVPNEYKARLSKRMQHSPGQVVAIASQGGVSVPPTSTYTLEGDVRGTQIRKVADGGRCRARFLPNTTGEGTPPAPDSKVILMVTMFIPTTTKHAARYSILDRNVAPIGSHACSLQASKSSEQTCDPTARLSGVCSVPLP